MTRTTQGSATFTKKLPDYAIAIDRIPGWYKPELLELVQHIDVWQRTQKIVGGVVEIGVYCGRSFVGLAKCCRLDEGERALAVDVFDNQEWNESKSGAGHVTEQRAIFDQTVAEFGIGGRTIALTADSRKLSADSIITSLGIAPRMFRVESEA